MTHTARPFLKLPLTVLLLMSGEPVYADWIKLVDNDQVGITVFADPKTVRRTGNLVKLWFLSDFKTTQTVADISYLSSKSQMEFDCAEERHRTLALTEFSGNMGKGEVVFNDASEQNWQPVAPESIGRMLWKAACVRK